MNLFIAPHNDDEALWGSYTIRRVRPTVMVVFDSRVQYARGVKICGWVARRHETLAALRELTEDCLAGCPAVPEIFAAFGDDEAVTVERLAAEFLVLAPCVAQVWAPAFEQDGHPHHNQVAMAADLAYLGKVTHYLTYTSRGKSRSGNEVLPRSGDDIARKLRALACYRSQLQMDPRLGCWPHFVNDLREYYAA